MFAKFLFRHEDDDLSGEVSHLYFCCVLYIVWSRSTLNKILSLQKVKVFLEGSILYFWKEGCCCDTKFFLTCIYKYGYFLLNYIKLIFMILVNISSMFKPFFDE